MSNTALPNTPPTSAPSFTQAELDRITDIAAKVAVSDKQLDSLLDRQRIKDLIAELPNKWAEGNASFTEALAGSLVSDSSVSSLVPALRSAAKTRIKVLIASLSDLVVKYTEHRLAELTALAGKLEASERRTSATLGIEDDVFEPSPMLQALRESIRRESEEARLKVAPNRTDFLKLALLAEAPTRRRHDPLAIEGLLDEDELS